MAESSEAQATRTSINSKVLLLSQEFGQFKADVNNKFNEINTNVNQKFNEIAGNVNQLSRDIQTSLHARTPKLNVWIPTAAVILGGFWFVLNLQLTSATKSLSDAVSRQEVTSAQNLISISRVQEQMPNIIQQNADSARDRTDLNRKFDFLTDRANRVETSQTRLDANMSRSLIEVETQLRASENYANLQRKYDNTMIALLWKKAYGEDYPVYQFYPSISQHDTGSFIQ
jgi:hypothetical protein